MTSWAITHSQHCICVTFCFSVWPIDPKPDNWPDFGLYDEQKIWHQTFSFHSNTKLDQYPNRNWFLFFFPELLPRRSPSCYTTATRKSAKWFVNVSVTSRRSIVSRRHALLVPYSWRRTKSRWTIVLRFVTPLGVTSSLTRVTDWRTCTVGSSGSLNSTRPQTDFCLQVTLESH